MTFIFRWKKRKWAFWSRKRVLGFQPSFEHDRMVLELASGGIYEIPKWSTMFCRLGKDFEKFAKAKHQNKES